MDPHLCRLAVCQFTTKQTQIALSAYSKAIIFQFTHYLCNHKVTVAPFRHSVRPGLLWRLCWGVSERPFVSCVASLTAVLIKDHFVLLMNVVVEERSGHVDRTGLHIQICYTCVKSYLMMTWERLQYVVSSGKFAFILFYLFQIFSCRDPCNRSVRLTCI